MQCAVRADDEDGIGTGCIHQTDRVEAPDGRVATLPSLNPPANYHHPISKQAKRHDTQARAPYMTRIQHDSFPTRECGVEVVETFNANQPSD